MDKTKNYLLKKKKKLRKCCCFSRTHSVFYFFNSSFQEFYPHFFIIILCSLFIVHFFHQNRKQKIFFIITLPDWFYMSLALHPDFSSLWRPPSAHNFILTTFYCWLLPSLSIVSFTTTQMFLVYTPFPYLIQVLPQHLFNKVFLGAISSVLIAVGFHVKVWSTVLVELFLWVTEQSTNLCWVKSPKLVCQNMLKNGSLWKV